MGTCHSGQKYDSPTRIFKIVRQPLSRKESQLLIPAVPAIWSFVRSSAVCYGAEKLSLEYGP